MQLDTLNRKELFDEISDLARNQGISTQEEWDGLVDEVVESHISLGELDEDQDLEGLKNALMEKWEVHTSQSHPESDADREET
ncbi:MAG: hypothetical protein ABII13_04940 [Patescibacteria group bacterium]|nr:hypothetical protein [Patescibacteria group bacterium]MBU2509078.1 hypothetical protein [Patescibacteria group bacterium]